MQTVSHDIEIAASPGCSFSFQTTPEAGKSTISRDLQNAIDQLRAIPSINIWELRSIRPNNSVSENQLLRSTFSDIKQRQLMTSDATTIHENNDVINDDTSRISDVTETDSAADDSTDDRSKYSMSWNIRRLRKHRLDPSGYRKSRDNTFTTAGLPSDVRNTSRERGVGPTSYEVGSDESLDSVVERILESTDDVFEDAKIYRVPSKPEVDTLLKTERGVVDTVNVTLNVNRRHMMIACDERDNETLDSRETSAPAPVNCVSNSALPCSSQTRLEIDKRQSEVTLEELFEEAVESLDSCHESNDRDIGNMLPTKPTDAEAADAEAAEAGKRYRGEENLERCIYDNELHQHCHQYRLHGYSVVSDTQYSRVSRGFALVEKVDKVSSPLTTRRLPVNGVENDILRCENDSTTTVRQFDRKTRPDDVVELSKHEDKLATDADGRTTFRQRTIISASLAPSGGGHSRINDDNAEDYIRKMNFDLDSEVAANVVGTASQHTGMSRASSITWDTISVDSLVMMDDDTSTVRAIYSAATLNTSAANAPSAIEDTLTDGEALRSTCNTLCNKSRFSGISVADVDSRTRVVNTEVIWLL